MSKVDIPLVDLLEFYKTRATSPYVCDVIVEYLTAERHRVYHLRDEISYQFYIQWMTFTNRENIMSRESFYRSFQSMDDWNESSDFFSDAGITMAHSKREYRIDCMTHVLEQCPNFMLTFNLQPD